ncbi:lectin [Luteimonas aquatica]|uniref:lectin n=1 Tax=Luteimonas aquatica TaxID=450364 RepID=UPI001F5AD864|nr:lectin [Luteimonas aquatica]
MTSLRHTTVIPALALLALGLAACNPVPPEGKTQDAVSASAPDQPGPSDQPAQDVPPATAPPADAPAPAPADADPNAMARMDGYGDMRFGMTLEAFKQAWGGELKGETTAECYYLTPKWVKVPSDFAFMFEGGKFVRYDVGTDKETAPGGGKRGMRAEEIGKLYAGRVEETPHKYVEGGKYLGIRDDKGGQGKLVFEVGKDGKVVDWRVGVPPQADYVEGCS